jgi:hypothetical protein
MWQKFLICQPSSQIPPNPPLEKGRCEKIQIEGGKSLSRCSGEGQIDAAKTRREIDAREALSRLPPSDAGNLEIFS